MTDIESDLRAHAPDWVAVHVRARHQRARLMRILFLRAWRLARRRWRRMVATPPCGRPAYEYWP